MAATFGELKEFSPESEKISVYLERASLYFTANAVDDDKKVPILLSAMGARTYLILRDLLAPAKPKDKSLEQITQCLQQHFEPKPIVIAQRFTFHQRNQRPQEPVTEYMADLRRLATHCEFGDFLSQALRDRFVCGLRDSAIQKRLLSERKLELQSALEMAQGMEAADAGTKQPQKQTQPFESLAPVAVARITRSELTSLTTSNLKPGQKCFRCGCTTHLANACKFAKCKCFLCGKTGHLKNVCRSKSAGSGFKKPRPVRVVPEEMNLTACSSLNALNSILTLLPVLSLMIVFPPFVCQCS